MLRSTFLHLPGIGEIRERRLWAQGSYSWNDLLTAGSQLELFPGRGSDHLRKAIEDSYAAIERQHADFFAERLPSREHYRVALAFPRKVAFLDIETTGLSLYYDRITLLGVYLDGEYHCFVDGQSIEPIRELLAEAKSVVTFNGSLFDLPFVRKAFSDLVLPKAHVDLRFLARRVGLAGGQKMIEAQVGIVRRVEVADVSGENAPTLYHNYRRGDLSSLRKLVQYNFADTTGMSSLFDVVLSRLRGPQTRIPEFTTRQPFGRAGRVALRFAKSPETTRRNSVFLTQYYSAHRRMTFHDLNLPQPRNGPLRIVGIDLTGSPQRPSGWAVLENGRAATRRLGTDDEIVRATLEVQPRIVSIDSPLSLPKGRTRVSDDDPARKSAGIMRECERVLKRRGVNVYPSLIPSMQSLTKRGISLAHRFRSLGVPVIESFPGAAQDVMGIPRKRTSLRHLTSGLQEFGLSGTFETQTISHDELDAITSAVVGAFFWSGRFEALGNEDEDYLIIPDLAARNDIWLARWIVGLCGPIDAGKTTGAEYLERSRSWLRVRFSELLAEDLRQHGREISRDALQEYGEEINKSGKQRWLAQRVAARIKRANSAVVDGVRFPEDVTTLVETFGPRAAIIYIDAPESIRRQRYLLEGYTVADFDRASKHPVETSVSGLESLAHAKVENTTTREAYLESLDTALSEFFGESPGDKEMVDVKLVGRGTSAS